jgi:hypothetical protein
LLLPLLIPVIIIGLIVLGIIFVIALVLGFIFGWGTLLGFVMIFVAMMFLVTKNLKMAAICGAVAVLFFLLSAAGLFQVLGDIDLSFLKMLKVW